MACGYLEVDDWGYMGYGLGVAQLPSPFMVPKNIPYATWAHFSCDSPINVKFISPLSGDSHLTLTCWVVVVAPFLCKMTGHTPFACSYTYSYFKLAFLLLNELLFLFNQRCQRQYGRKLSLSALKCGQLA